VDTGAFTALINPGMSLVFAAAFFMLWWNQRDRHFIAVMAASFLALSFGFLLQYFTLFNLTLTKLLSNLLLLAGGTGLATGSLARFGCRTPVARTGIFGAAGFIAFLWYLVVDPDITGRVYAINFAVGAISLVIAVEIRSSSRTFRFVDKLLVALTTFFGLSYFVRPVVAVYIEGPYTSYEGFHNSIYWTTMSVSSSMFLLLFSLLLITAIALDLMDELRQESQTDPLSGLLNRRGLEERATEMLRNATRRKSPLAVVVCDIDHFKAINDTFGHATGDAVIAAFATCLRDCVGPHNLVARLGGEEFAVLLQGATSAVGRLFAESTRTTLGVLKLPCLPPEHRLTASFGVAEWTGSESLQNLVSRADAALYEAKKAGRDCVRVAPDGDNVGLYPMKETAA